MRKTVPLPKTGVAQLILIFNANKIKIEYEQNITLMLRNPQEL